MINEKYALYVTSFPPEKYRRPILAARALLTLGLKTKILDGWKIVSMHKMINNLTRVTSFFPKPLDWLTKDLLYETGLLTSISKNNLACCINLNILGTISEKIRIGEEVPLVIDCQDVTIQDDGTIPIYDRLMLRNANGVIFASKAIKNLVEKQYPKLLKNSAYIPFGIELTKFDIAYGDVKAEYFLNYYSLQHKILLTYSGAAYFWGGREGQGLQLLIKSARIVINENPEVRFILQGAAPPNTFTWNWLQREINEHGLKDKVILVPPMNPYHPLRMSLFKASTAFLLPIGDILGTYYAEQQKLFEYMASAKPIIMVATPARLSILDSNSAYIAYQRKPEEFATQILNVLEEREEANVKGLRARKILEQKYDWKVLIPQYAQFIKSMIEKH